MSNSQEQEKNAPAKRVPVILTIAGSDSGGGAGIQADVKTMTVLGGFGTSVITALTAQNGAGVRGIHAPDAGFVALQLAAVLEGFPVAAAKTGMLFSAPIIEAVAAGLAGKRFPLVVDPVAVSQSGHRLLEESAVQALVRHIVPLADLLTPNRPEAEALTGVEITDKATLEQAGQALLAMGAKAVLIKGGHFEEAHAVGGGRAELTDWLCLPGAAAVPYSHPRVETPNNHGTGCTLSAALATFLGQGLDLDRAVRAAQRFLGAALAASFTPGIGAGPPNVAAGAAAVRQYGE